MSNRAIIASTTASATVGVLPALNIGPLNALGPLAKIAIGGALTWFAMTRGGVAWAIGLGLGVGMVVDGVLDLALGNLQGATVSA